MFRSNPSVQAGQYAELSNGLRMHYASCGDRSAPLLLMLHGFPEFWFAWHDLMPRFADQCHVVAPDLRGYNLSDKPADVAQYQMPLLVTDVVELIEALGYQKACIVAHDWGGMVAWATCIARPDRISAAMILNAPHPIPFARDLANDSAQQTASRYMNRLRQPSFESELLANQCAGFEKFFRAPGSERWFTPEVAAQYRTAWQQPGAAAAALNYYRASPLYPPQGRDAGAGALELDPAQYRVQTPVRVLWGLKDSALLAPLLNGLDDHVDDLQVEQLDDATHWLHHEQPQWVADRIEQFIREYAHDTAA